MDDDEIILEDWKITKDRIKHFDDILMRTRLQGIPIATALQAAAFITSGSIGKITVPVLGSDWPIFSLILLAGILYLIPVLLLDLFHFSLLIIAVNHAKKIEEENFNQKLGITRALTKRWLTILHVLAYGVYLAIFVIGLHLINQAPNILEKLN